MVEGDAAAGEDLSWPEVQASRERRAAFDTQSALATIAARLERLERRLNRGAPLGP
jgi:hypothetical protein